jgi:hypothetical protein
MGYWDYVPLFEYFHVAMTRGIGTRHQTGWTELLAKQLQLYGTMSAEMLLERSL